MTHVQVRVPAVFVNSVRVLGAAWVQQAGEEFIRRVIDGMSVSIVCIKRKAVTRPLREVD